MAVPVNHLVLNPPSKNSVKTLQPIPKKTEEEKIRIDQLRKVEGEMLNYKKFESADDVRRIVWKIFAKNKELMVRIPEIMDPFSSHVYIYASFYTDQQKPFPSFNQTMLNYYKHKIWAVYETLENQEFNLKYIPDQLLGCHEKEVLKAITLSDWHQNQNILQYFKPQSGSILLLHSYSNLQDVSQMLSAIDQNTVLYFVKLSKAFQTNYVLHWLTRILFISNQDEQQSLKNKWHLHPVKFSMLKREKKLIQLLIDHDCNFEIL